MPARVPRTRTEVQELLSKSQDVPSQGFLSGSGFVEFTDLLKLQELLILEKDDARWQRKHLIGVLPGDANTLFQTNILPSPEKQNILLELRLCSLLAIWSPSQKNPSDKRARG